MPGRFWRYRRSHELQWRDWCPHLPPACSTLLDFTRFCSTWSKMILDTRARSPPLCARATPPRPSPRRTSRRRTRRRDDPSRRRAVGPGSPRPLRSPSPSPSPASSFAAAVRARDAPSSVAAPQPLVAAPVAENVPGAGLSLVFRDASKREAQGVMGEIKLKSSHHTLGNTRVMMRVPKCDGRAWTCDRPPIHLEGWPGF